MLSLQEFCIGAGRVAAVVLFAGTLAMSDEPARPPSATSPEQAVALMTSASKAGDLEGVLHQSAQPFRDLMLWWVLAEESDQILNAALNEKFGTQQPRGFGMGVKYDLLRIRKSEIRAREVVSETRVKLTVRETVLSFADNTKTGLRDVDCLAVKEGEHWKVFRPYTALVFVAGDNEVTTIVEKAADGEEIKISRIRFEKELDELGREMEQAYNGTGTSLPERLEELRQRTRIAEEIAAGIAKGKYASRNEATAAFQTAAGPLRE